jgi:putative ABC transport system ATP-binding protein
MSFIRFCGSRSHELGKVFGQGRPPFMHCGGVDLEVGDGEFVSIMGPSGSGKSTLLYILGALDRPSGGHVEVHGRRFDNLDDRELTRLRGEVFGFVFQFFNLLPTLTAAENVLLPALVAGEHPRTTRTVSTSCSRSSASASARRTCRRRCPAASSSGWRSRRAMLRGPRCCSPTSRRATSIPPAAPCVLGLLRRLVDEGQTVVMVTHDAAAATLADRVVFLRDGEIVQEVAGGDRERVGDALRVVQTVGYADPVTS